MQFMGKETLKSTLKRRNPKEEKPGKEQGEVSASQAQMAFTGSHDAQEAIVSEPNADLDAHFIAGTFLALCRPNNVDEGDSGTHTLAQMFCP